MSEAPVLPLAEWVLGSSLECDLVVSQPVVSGRHCLFSVYASEYVLEDLGSTNGTFVNGYKLDAYSPVVVYITDKITLGRSIPMPWPPNQQSDLRPGDQRPITIGRNPQSTLCLDRETISWNHARVVREEDGWYIEDAGSTNGLALNTIDNRITRGRLRPDDDIFLGSVKVAASRILSRQQATEGESAFERVTFTGDRMILGRDPACDYPLDFPFVSWHHAELSRVNGVIYVEDIGSRNGTYVDDIRITSKTAVLPGQEIGLGSFRFQLLEDGNLAKREYIGNVTIEVRDLVAHGDKGIRLLDPVSLTIFPSELVALMGPAGSGKTTLLQSMNGYKIPQSGEVRFNGADLYTFYDRFRTQMSYVPQDDIIHSELTVGEALYFSAKLRTDLRDEEIAQRTVKVLAALEIGDKKDTIVGSPEKKRLSGGQRKRVNIAMELINDTPVIFLDEPTSGLSSYDAEGVIRILKELSTKGKTIITTIHQPSLDIFRQFDCLIMLSRDVGDACGALAYFGPAYPASIEFFAPESAEVLKRSGRDLNPEMLFSGLKDQKTGFWVSKYQQSRAWQLFVRERAGKIPSTPDTTPKRAGQGFGFSQWWTLVQRNILLKSRDRLQAALLLLQAPLFALLVGAVFGKLEQAPNLPAWLRLAGQVTGIDFLLVVAAIWFGCNNAARDIVGERVIFRRERMVTLKLPSYVLSKFAVSAVLGAFQCVVLLGIVYAMCHLHGSFLVTLGILYMSSLVGTALGLCVSAYAPTTEAAIAMLPLILLPIISLGGGIHPIKDMRSEVQWIAKAVPSRWAFEAVLITEAEAQERSPAVPGRVNSDVAEERFPGARNSVQRCVSVLAAMLILWLTSALSILKFRKLE